MVYSLPSTSSLLFWQSRTVFLTSWQFQNGRTSSSRISQPPIMRNINLGVSKKKKKKKRKANDKTCVTISQYKLYPWNTCLKPHKYSMKVQSLLYGVTRYVSSLALPWPAVGTYATNTCELLAYLPLFR